MNGGKKEKGFRLCPESFVISGTPGKDRTCDLRIRNPSLYPLSYGGTDSSAQSDYAVKNLRLPSRRKSTPFLYCDHRRMDEDCVEATMVVIQAVTKSFKLWKMERCRRQNRLAKSQS